MTNTSEYPAGGHYLAQITRQMYETGRIGHVEYSNITLAGPGIVSEHDPDVRLENQSLNALWPGGSPAGNLFESIITPEGDVNIVAAEEVLLNRGVLLEGSVDAAAFDRVPGELKQHWNSIRQSVAPLLPIQYAEGRARLMNAPLCIAVGSRVLRSTIHQPNDRMVHLWYPVDVNPKAVLIRMRQGVRQAVNEETI